MKAAICTKYGNAEVVKVMEYPQPQVQADEILVKVHATTLSSGDCRVRGAAVPALYKPFISLIYGFGKPRQPILGTEFAGEIVALGQDVKNFQIGDKVFGMTGMKMGAHAEYLALKNNGKTLAMPTNFTNESAAAIAFGGTAALHFLRKAQIKAGDRILIYGASGSVGSSAVQIAKALKAHVTAVCSGRNRELVEGIGADEVIDYQQEDFRQSENKYDIVFDAVGKIKKADAKQILAPQGRYVSVSGAPASEKPADLLYLKELAESGAYQPVIDRSYPLEEIVEAYRYVETGRKRGNVVLTL